MMTLQTLVLLLLVAVAGCRNRDFILDEGGYPQVRIKMCVSEAQQGQLSDTQRPVCIRLAVQAYEDALRQPTAENCALALEAAILSPKVDPYAVRASCKVGPRQP